MENKDLIIIALIILVIYLYYQQTQPKTLSIQPDNTEIQELRNQVNHYQTLYQKRVAKDLGSEEIVKIHQQKIKDLEKQLLDLAKSKLKGKKEFQELVRQLETNWQAKEENWTHEKKTIFQNYEKDKQNWQKDKEVHQEQLKKINLLFDDQAKDYETIDFNGLLSLLQQVAERERERAKIGECPEVEEIKPIFSKHRKKKK